jgi:zinc transporter ZupT
MKVLQIFFVIIFNLLFHKSCITCDHEFSKEIIENFSNTSSLNKDQFYKFLITIGFNNETCLKYQKNYTENVDYQELSNLCPNILHQIVINKFKNVTKIYESSHQHQNHNHDNDDSKSEESRSLIWIYGTVAITVISLCGLAGVIVIPIVEKQYYFYVLQFFMALAVGTLTGDSLMHLLPHSIQPSSDDVDTSQLHTIIMQKGIAMMLGIICFWFLEKLLKLFTQKTSNNNNENEVKRLEVEHKHGHSHGDFDVKSESLSSIVWMVVLGDGLHNFTDGMTIGAAFSHSIAGGFSTTVAVFCHELPHELGDFAVLLKAGMPVKQAIFYNIISSILSFIGMCMGIMFGDTPETSQWVFAIAAGLFIYIALVDMVSNQRRNKKT